MEKVEKETPTARDPNQPLREVAEFYEKYSGTGAVLGGLPRRRPEEPSLPEILPGYRNLKKSPNP